MNIETIKKIEEAIELEINDYTYCDIDIKESESYEGAYDISFILYHDAKIEFTARIEREDEDWVWLEILMDSDCDDWQEMSGGGIWKYLAGEFCDRWRGLV